MLIDFQLDRAGVREILTSAEVRTMVNGVADQIAQGVRLHLPDDVVVEVRPYTTDRDAATVAILDPRAMGWQARDGILTGTAGGLGIEVKAWQR